MIQLWICSQCNTNNNMSDALCTSCGTPQPVTTATNQQQTTQPPSGQQITYNIIMPHINPTINQTANQTVPSPVWQQLQGLFSQIISNEVIRAIPFIAVALGIIIQCFPGILHSPIFGPQYTYIHAVKVTTVSIDIPAGEGIVVADGVTSQDMQYANLPVSYQWFSNSGLLTKTVQVNLTYGYIEEHIYYNPLLGNRVYDEYCKHLQQAINNGIPFGYACVTG